MKNLIEKWTKEQIKIIIEHYKIQINLCKASGQLKITCFYVKIYNVLWQQIDFCEFKSEITQASDINIPRNLTGIDNLIYVDVHGKLCCTKTLESAIKLVRYNEGKGQVLQIIILKIELGKGFSFVGKLVTYGYVKDKHKFLINKKDMTVMKKQNSEMVNSILRNENYTGKSFQGKKRKLNYRVNKKINIDKENNIWTIKTYK